MDSIWTEGVEMPVFAPLYGDARTDVLIIGGGMAGILCAYMLQQAGVPYILAEADVICSGATGKTTAKITAQHGLIYHKLIREFGEEKARLYLQANMAAVDVYGMLCRQIDCDYERKDSYVYTVRETSKLEKEADALRRIGYPAEYVQELPLPFAVQGALRFAEQAQFHPLKFVAAIARQLNIYEHTKILEFREGEVVTAHGRISAERIIAATHFPMNNKHGAYFLKMYQRRSYVLALRGAKEVSGMYIDEAVGGMSFRNEQDLLLLGGGGHRTGKKGGGWRELAEFAEKYYPDAVIQAQWAAQDCMTLDGVPYIGRYGKHTQNFYVTTGYNKWGMTSAMVSALLLRDLLLENENEWSKVFTTSRTILRPQLLANGIAAMAGMLRLTAKRCPHMGCALRWNEEERSWDCSCHGSRFTEAGELIDQPATGDLKLHRNL